MSEREALCPECDTPLVVSVEKNKKTKELQIRFWCEGDYEDRYESVIHTSLTNEDLKMIEKGKPVAKQMTITVIKRKRVPKWEREYL
jgi:hypothetical protein